MNIIPRVLDTCEDETMFFSNIEDILNILISLLVVDCSLLEPYRQVF